MTKPYDISFHIGIDLGGTKTEIAAYDPAGNEIYKKRVPTPQQDYIANIANIKQLVLELEQKLGKKGCVGVGIPGCMSQKTGLVKGANSTWLIGKPLDKDISEALNRPVRIANDANCFALSEAAALKHRNDLPQYDLTHISSVFGVILGTGVGGGLILNQQVIHGANGIAGEWGHNPLPERELDTTSPPPCYCGRKGCIETYLSGPALSRQYEEVTGQSLSGTEIAVLADQGNAQALAVMKRYENRLAKALGSVINTYDPEVIILGGGLSRIDRIYRTIPEQWSDYIFSDFVETILLPPYFGDSSGVRGAAWLWEK